MEIRKECGRALGGLNPLVTVLATALLLERDTMAKATLIRENI